MRDVDYHRHLREGRPANDGRDPQEGAGVIVWVLVAMTVACLGIVALAIWGNQ